MEPVVYQLIDQARRRLGRHLRITHLEQGLIFNHRNALYFLAQLDRWASHLAVPLAVEFPDHPDDTGDALLDRAMDNLSPRLRDYYRRGYRLRETEWRPRGPHGAYREDRAPTVIVFVDRPMTADDDIIAELIWLIARLPQS